MALICEILVNLSGLCCNPATKSGVLTAVAGSGR